MRVTRRGLIGGAAALVAAGRARAEQRGLAATALGVDAVLVGGALDALWRHRATIWSRDLVAIADFGLPSAQPRLHVVDLLAGRVTSLLVAHGRGSDPDHTGLLQTFSNTDGSAATSEGAYLTGPTYTGVHGLSRRLTGLDPTNDRAEPRAIVIHSAWYADPTVAARQGKLGRSDGCFAVSPQAIGWLLATLGEGRLLYAGRRHNRSPPSPLPPSRERVG